MKGPESRPVPYWKVILAAILDFLIAFILIGWGVAWMFGRTTANGFQVSGGPALLLFGLIIAYFILAPRVGGTLGQRVLQIPVQKR